MKMCANCERMNQDDAGVCVECGENEFIEVALNTVPIDIVEDA